MKGRLYNKGFTLVEILITLLIVSVGMLALGSFFASSIKLEGLAQERIAAVHMAEQIIEDWQRTNTLPTPACTVPNVAVTALTIGSARNNCVADSGVPVAFSVMINERDARGPLPTDHPNNSNASAAGAVVTGVFLKVDASNNLIPNSPVKVRIVSVSWQHDGNPYNIYLTHITRYTNG